MKRTLLPSIVFAATFGADIASKRLVEANMDLGTVITMISNFNLVYVVNRGISFGLFASDSAYSPYLLSLAGLLIIIFMAAWALRTDSLVQRLSLALITGGAAGNVLDRLDDGAVTDFLDFYIGAYHWPSFNFADIAIVCGVATLLLDSILPSKRNPSEGEERPRVP